MLLNPSNAFMLTGYPLARLRGMSCVARVTRAAPCKGATQDAVYRGRVHARHVRWGLWQFEIHSLHRYLREMQQ
ncbi:MAG: hypothetical protein LC737_01665, partial [Chloroflexi bacterium]|nr:hypothetical protein [Chloroflexota bacterium]